MKEVRGQEIISLDFCKEGGITEMIQQVVVDWVLYVEVGVVGKVIPGICLRTTLKYGNSVSEIKKKYSGYNIIILFFIVAKYT